MVEINVQVISKPPKIKTAPPAVTTKVSENKMDPKTARANPSKANNEDLFSSEPVPVISYIRNPPMQLQQMELIFGKSSPLFGEFIHQFINGPIDWW